MLQDLDKFVVEKHGLRLVRLWLEEFEKRHEPRDRALNIVDYWLSTHPTIECFKIAAACVEAIGIRKDLSILERYAIEGPSDEVAKIRASARFYVYRRSLE